jgi:predicted NodU family carbamoyl transferase
MTGPLVLGIESSCDETAVALVRGDRTILSQRIASQNEAHERFGGVVPELAARAHADRLAPMVETVLTEAGIALTDVDAIAGTAGGATHSAEAIRFRIKGMIAAEPPDDILSDDAIVERLRKEGVDIARRTVAKYREALRIPSSVQRKREKAVPA